MGILIILGIIGIIWLISLVGLDGLVGLIGDRIDRFGFKHSDYSVYCFLRCYDCQSGGYRAFKILLRKGHDEPSCVSCFKLWQKWKNWKQMNRMKQCPDSPGHGASVVSGVSAISAQMRSSDASDARPQDTPQQSDLSGLDLVKSDPGMELLPAHMHGKQWPVRPWARVCVWVLTDLAVSRLLRLSRLSRLMIMIIDDEYE